MQDYSKLYPSKLKVKRKVSKLHQVRKLILSDLPAEIIIVLIAVVIMPGSVANIIRR